MLSRGSPKTIIDQLLPRGCLEMIIAQMLPRSFFETITSQMLFKGSSETITTYMFPRGSLGQQPLRCSLENLSRLGPKNPPFNPQIFLRKLFETVTEESSEPFSKSSEDLPFMLYSIAICFQKLFLITQTHLDLA